MDINESAIVVIRSAQERTIEICKELVAKQIDKDNIITLHEYPFELALRKCYELGNDSNAKWMVTLDADVLLRSSSIKELVLKAEQMPENYIQLEGRIFDKIMGMYRQAGHRVYRTKFLSQALNTIPSAGTQIRPEYFTLQQLGKIGYPSRRVADVFGLHDFEQYYLDLYRKSVVHAQKHSYFVPNLIERCTRYLHKDTDYLVILKGLWDGLIRADAVTIDKRRFLEDGRRALDELCLEEKASIVDKQSFVDHIHNYYAEIVREYPVPEFQVQDDPHEIVVVKNSWYSLIQQRFERYGLIKGSLTSVGVLLKMVGKALDHQNNS
jgi:hypothetical protein